MNVRSHFRLPTRTAVLLLAVTAVAATAQATARTSAAMVRGNAVIDWNEIAQNAIVVGRPAGSSSVLEGIVQAAIYDATVAIEGGYEPFVATPTVTHPASTETAVAAAARGVLVVRVPGQAAYVDGEYAAYLATIPDGPAKTNGISAGEQVAAAILAWRADDGFENNVPWEQPPPGPGIFEPVFPPTPVDVKLKQVRPLTLTSNSQFRPDGPNPLTSPAYAEDFNEIKVYGGADSTLRTPAQTQTARFWAENTALQWPRNLRKLALEENLGLAETARMLALTQVATADAILACFDAKYHYLFWRPFHAVPRGDTDGNPATEPDPNWTPLLYPNLHPNHPEYPGAHGCWSAAVTDTLRAFFGTDKIAFSIDSTVSGAGPTRYYERFTDAAKEAYDARIWGGLHFPNSIMEGAWIGHKIARYVVANFFRPTDG